MCDECGWGEGRDGKRGNEKSSDRMRVSEFVNELSRWRPYHTLSDLLFALGRLFNLIQPEVMLLFT